MKVFDFSNGKKGAYLGEAPRPSFGNGSLRNGMFYTNKNKSYEFHFKAGRTNFKTSSDDLVTPEMFGVQAICFCIGEIYCGTDSHWEWWSVGTEEWIENSVKSGLVIIEKRG